MLIGTPERARKLRPRLPYLAPPDKIDPEFGPEPKQCPSTILYGYTISRALYSNRELQPALDAWDSGAVSPGDLHRWCLWIEAGNYHGPTYVHA